MSIDPQTPAEPYVQPKTGGGSRGSGIVFSIVAIALILAIGFFYLTNDKRSNRQAEAVTGAAESIDETVKVVGDAAKDAADRLRNDN